MAGLRLERSDADGLVVFLGSHAISDDDVHIFYHQDEGKAWITFVGDRNDTANWLLADLAATGPNIERISTDYIKLSLLQRTWRGQININLAEREAEVRCSPVWSQWSSIVSFAALRAAFEDRYERYSSLLFIDDREEIATLLPLDPSLRLLGEVLQDCKVRLASMVDAAFQQAAMAAPTAVVSVFHFPEAVAAPCEQYLVHFIDFLRDLGVKATGDIRHEAGRVLFTVTPQEHSQALASIREALNVYLQLPVGTLDGTSESLSDQVTIDKLQMNVHHLKSQLTAAGMMLRLQESTIAAQEVTIAAHRELMAGAPRTTGDSEVIVEGILDVVPLEGHGVRINLPRLIRRLKDLLRS